MSEPAKLPLPTFVTFVVFALVLWLNAVVNRYLFNVMLALVASVPVLFLLALGALDARRARVDRLPPAPADA